VLAHAARYATRTPDSRSGGETPQGEAAPSDAAAEAALFAVDLVGQPYVWGGDGSEGGFDCSGLTHAAYAAAGVQLPRTQPPGDRSMI
jgi:cell wall-associated NlpC family hydrolase